jgi:2-polyprenyl-3-methyl-5-hydroxy-6-metoxy-1,4-benzoquinol methylase
LISHFSEALVGNPDGRHGPGYTSDTRPHFLSARPHHAILCLPAVHTVHTDCSHCPHSPQGHAVTVEKTLAWLDESALSGVTVADCGCGTGSLAIPLALRGATVSAADISAAMAGEAAER